MCVLAGHAVDGDIQYHVTASDKDRDSASEPGAVLCVWIIIHALDCTPLQTLG